LFRSVNSRSQFCHQVQHHLLQDLRVIGEMFGIDSHEVDPAQQSA